MFPNLLLPAERLQYVEQIAADMLELKPRLVLKHLVNCAHDRLAHQSAAA